MASRTLVEAHRRDLRQLSTLAESDLRIMFRRFDTAEAARDGLRTLLPRLVAIYGSAAATLGADWYDDLRDLAGARGRFTAIPAELPDRGRTDALAGWGVGPLFAPEPDFNAALALVAGGLQRIIADAARQTTMGSSIEDPGASGWSRETAGGCAFCEMIAGRGEVFSEATADFASHDNCQCSAVPAFDGLPRPVKPYTPTARNITDKDRARVRKYLREH